MVGILHVGLCGSTSIWSISSTLLSLENPLSLRSLATPFNVWSGTESCINPIQSTAFEFVVSWGWTHLPSGVSMYPFGGSTFDQLMNVINSSRLSFEMFLTLRCFAICLKYFTVGCLILNGEKKLYYFQFRLRILFSLAQMKLNTLSLITSEYLSVIPTTNTWMKIHIFCSFINWCEFMNIAGFSICKWFF